MGDARIFKKVDVINILKNQSLVLCACGMFSLAITPSTSADIAGVEAKVRTDLTFCQDTS